MRISGRSDPGKERQSNEDNFFFRVYKEGYAIVAVADGMGGHAAGEVASAIAVDVISRFTQSDEMPDFYHEFADTKFEDYVVELVKRANSEIYEAAKNDDNKTGMGTTLTLSFISNKRLFIGHVGDSRIYRLSGNTMERLTKDHTVVEEMLNEGRINKNELINHPRRHMLTRALGTTLEIEVDVEIVSLNKGDILLFCTDGLTSLIEEEEIKQVVLEKGIYPLEAVDNLIALANDRGGYDNITLVIVTEIGEE